MWSIRPSPHFHTSKCSSSHGLLHEYSNSNHHSSTRFLKSIRFHITFIPLLNIKTHQPTHTPTKIDKDLTHRRSFNHPSQWYSDSKNLSAKRSSTGVPLSMLLFILSTNILTQKINSNIDLPGLKISKVRIKIQQYADGVTCILTNDDIEELSKILNEFLQHSRLSINPAKSKFLSNSNYTKLQHFSNLIPKDELKILGILFSLKNDTSIQTGK